MNPKCFSKMFMVFGKCWKQQPEVMHIFAKHFGFFKLTHIVFELGHLNPINILNALKILKLLEGCWG